MDQNSARPLEPSASVSEKPPILAWLALGLPLIAAFCCLLVYLPIAFTEAGLFFYWRDLVRIGVAETVFCFGGMASFVAIVLGGVALVQRQKYKAVSIIGIILGLLVGISACLVMPFFLLLMFSSQ